jgi:DNA-binding transcriptional MerR regulator
MSDGFSTLDMETILGVPEYTILYWERCLPLVKPVKHFGRRRFSVSDACLLLRMKHYIVDQKLNPSKAGRQILDERINSNSRIMHELHALRCEILTHYGAFLALRGTAKKAAVLREESQGAEFPELDL